MMPDAVELQPVVSAQRALRWMPSLRTTPNKPHAPGNRASRSRKSRDRRQPRMQHRSTSGWRAVHSASVTPACQCCLKPHRQRAQAALRR